MCLIYDFHTNIKPIPPLNLLHNISFLICRPQDFRRQGLISRTVLKQQGTFPFAVVLEARMMTAAPIHNNYHRFLKISAAGGDKKYQAGMTRMNNMRIPIPQLTISYAQNPACALSARPARKQERKNGADLEPIAAPSFFVNLHKNIWTDFGRYGIFRRKSLPAAEMKRRKDDESQVF